MKTYIIKTDNRRNCRIYSAPTTDRPHASLPRFDFDEFGSEEDAVKHLIESVSDWLYDLAGDAVSGMAYDTDEEISAYEIARDNEYNRIISDIKDRGGWDYDGIYYSIRELKDEES